MLPPLIASSPYTPCRRFNTIGVSDGISMGTDGMSFR
jgi:dihydroxyacid dehydratase/phosphogluconate dehydratase